MDFSPLSRNWYSGQRFVELAAEVENFWHELHGTLRDLLTFQAREKWGVFYHADLDPARRELQNATTAVWQSFETQGFQEAPSTAYEILVLPEQIPATGLIGHEIVFAEFASSLGTSIPYPTKMIL